MQPAIKQELLLNPGILKRGFQDVRADQLRGVFFCLRHRRRAGAREHPLLELAVDRGLGPPDGQAQPRILTGVRNRVRLRRQKGIAVG
ncbi:MAG: hypothetical protein BWX68_02981 [Verrucomicrobia bacterium ADurb.Bin063]|nr:MAG: hypothetical protein BWX68_02981 [Verrucomicrobia bacterium ADurb.Bin063]